MTEWAAVPAWDVWEVEFLGGADDGRLLALPGAGPDWTRTVNFPDSPGIDFYNTAPSAVVPPLTQVVYDLTPSPRTDGRNRWVAVRRRGR